MPSSHQKVRIWNFLLHFGGVDVLVPEGWKVIDRGVPILGGFVNKTIPPAANDSDVPTLRVHYVTFCGGIDIKNKE